MSESNSKQISASRIVHADAQRIFDVIADPSLHHVIDGSGSVKGTTSGSHKLGLGDTFGTSMRIGVPYRMRNRVVEYSEGRRIAWAHVGGWRWRYELEPIEEGPDAGATLVTETFDWSPSQAGWYIDAMKWPSRNLRNMERTLSRLDAFVTNTSAAF
ncbi:MAG: SRPBCC family protein [Microthrixaceae bacterium]